MAERILTIVSGRSTIIFNDLDGDNDLEIEIEDTYNEYRYVYLNKDGLISLHKHLEYFVKKL